MWAVLPAWSPDGSETAVTPQMHCTRFLDLGKNTRSTSFGNISPLCAGGTVPESFFLKGRGFKFGAFCSCRRTAFKLSSIDLSRSVACDW